MPTESKFDSEPAYANRLPEPGLIARMLLPPAPPLASPMMKAWPPTMLSRLLPLPRSIELPLLAPLMVPPLVTMSLSKLVTIAAAVALPPAIVAPALLVIDTVKPVAGPSTTIAESFWPRITPPALFVTVALP